MVTCGDFYDKFARVGNFCRKSENTANEIEKYIEYVKKYELRSFEINRCALKPFVQIENSEYLHTRCLRELKKKCRRIGGRHITRPIAIEIINKVNDAIPIQYRIKEIPEVRSRVRGFQHGITSISYENREMFDKFKDEVGFRSNNDVMTAVLKYCSGNSNVIEEIKSLMKLSEQETEKEKERLNDGDVPGIIVREQ